MPRAPPVTIIDLSFISKVCIVFSLTGVLSVSALPLCLCGLPHFYLRIHRRDAEDAEITQKHSELVSPPAVD